MLIVFDEASWAAEIFALGANKLYLFVLMHAACLEVLFLLLDPCLLKFFKFFFIFFLHLFNLLSIKSLELLSKILLNKILWFLSFLTSWYRTDKYYIIIINFFNDGFDFTRIANYVFAGFENVWEFIFLVEGTAAGLTF